CHAPPLGPAVERDLARHDVRVEEATRPQHAGHLADDGGGIAEVLEEPAREDHVERGVGERERGRVAEDGVAVRARAPKVLAHRADRVRRVVERDEAIRALAAEPDKETARAGADLDRAPGPGQERAQAADLPPAEDGEDVASPGPAP